MKFYNTLTRQKEDFNTIKKNNVSIYVCGPTVYGDVHIGNLRPVVVFDVLKRYLEYKGNTVDLVSNVTDVDDKIVNAAIQNNTTELELSTHYANEYFTLVEILGCKLPDQTPKVSEYMDKIIAYIEKLVKKDYAYEVDGNVYFNLNKAIKYGLLSNQSIEDLQVGVRIEENYEKKHPLDFTLWKKTDKGIKWSSPWSEGRPGWHTECVAMINDVFKGEIDIHGGGVDLKFPHHENEIAQNRVLHNNSIARTWMHVGRVMMGKDKMSKSLGNIVTAKDFVAKHGAPVLKLLLFATNYRQPLSYTPELLEAVDKKWNSLVRTWKTAFYKLDSIDELVEKDQLLKEVQESYMQKYDEAMANDLNIGNVLVLIYELEKQLNKYIRINSLQIEQIMELKQVYATFVRLLDLLGIHQYFDKLTAQNKEDLAKWKQARADKNFDEADKYRDILTNQGIPLV